MIGRFTILAAATFFCLLSCDHAHAPAAFASALDTGSSWATRVSAEQTLTQSMGGRDIEARQSFSTTYRFTVLGRDPGGALSMEAVYEGLSLRISSPLGTWSFDSSGAVDPESRFAALRALVGGRFTFSLGPDMRVRDLGGLSELAARIAVAARNPILAASASSWMNEAAMRSSLEAMFGLFPGGKIAVGQSWNVSSSPGGGMPVVAHNTITATKVSGDKMSATIDGRIEGAGEGGAAELRGKQDGSVDLDRARLRILGGGVSQDLVGSVMVSGTKVPITVHSVISFDSVDVVK